MCVKKPTFCQVLFLDYIYRNYLESFLSSTELLNSQIIPEPLKAWKPLHYTTLPPNVTQEIVAQPIYPWQATRKSNFWKSKHTLMQQKIWILLLNISWSYVIYKMNYMLSMRTDMYHIYGKLILFLLPFKLQLTGKKKSGLTERTWCWKSEVLG